MKKLVLLSLFMGFASASASAQAQTVIMQQPGTSLPPGVVYAQPTMVAPQPYCRDYTDKISIGTEFRVTHGIACLQPDGSWSLRPTQAPVNYVTRDNGLYLVPAQPFRTVIIAHGEHGEHHHEYHHSHYDH